MPFTGEAQARKHYPEICIIQRLSLRMKPGKEPNLIEHAFQRDYIDISTHLIWNSTKQVQIQLRQIRA